MKTVFPLVAVAACLLASCTAHRYFPVRQQVYHFDTVGDLRVPFNAGVNGAFGSVAYSPFHRFAIAAHAQAGYNLNLDLKERNSGYGGGIGTGFYAGNDGRHDFDAFLTYDAQRVRTRFVREHVADTTVYKTYHSLRLQPSYYYRFTKIPFSLFVACGATSVATKAPHYFAFAPTIGNYVVDVVVEPSVGFVTRPFTVAAGVSPVFSLYHGWNAAPPNALGQFDGVTKATPYPNLRYYVNLVFTDGIVERNKRKAKRAQR